MNRIAKRIKLEIKLLLLNIIKHFKSFPRENSILIFSDPRGGSTWLAELLNHIPNSIIYWEPLAPNHNKYIRKINFGWRQHIPENANWQKANNAFDKILQLNPLNEWTTKRFNVSNYVDCKIPIIKFCRGNHLIHWLCNQYQFKYKPIVLLRHPFAVVASQLKQGGWDYTFDGFTIPNMSHNDTYLKNKEFLESLQSKEESLVAIWCITNRELQLPNSKWILCFYEDLLLNTSEAIEDILKEWKIEMPKNLYGNLHKASFTTVDLAEDSSQKQLAKWHHYFNDEMQLKLQRVLNHFEINIYSKDSLYPINRYKNV
ncbi:sulfotransferase domain-containing protein [Reichenbachiella agarivorans]|uniref:Sulfotransferase domain-containing protein n=1 Tax=Reichenbachiella agarivorans TaxID=2979464 RepID=A0ABY6CR10_9BACT|nr:sulfotransferase domain-containing protein [Reichenbachiella agarivorans]UXP32947.1 sulfotransferase domain-containing protein [Reichenbachiella agarivorans]